MRRCVGHRPCVSTLLHDASPEILAQPLPLTALAVTHSQHSQYIAVGSCIEDCSLGGAQKMLEALDRVGTHTPVEIAYSSSRSDCSPNIDRSLYFHQNMPRKKKKKIKKKRK